MANDVNQNDVWAHRILGNDYPEYEEMKASLIADGESVECVVAVLGEFLSSIEFPESF